MNDPHLQFQISLGRLTGFDATGTPATIGPAYAGAPGFVNDPAATSVKRKGPLPVGWYTIGAPVSDPVTGLFTLPLTPVEADNPYGLPATWMWNRGEFKIHGADAKKDVNGAQASSEGCIVAGRPERVVCATFQLLEVIA